MHCCVLQISCIQGTPLYPVSCRTLQCFALSAMDVDRIDTYPAMLLSISNVFRGSIVLAKILDPSKRGADCQTITYERRGAVVTHDCAPTTLKHRCPSVCSSVFFNSFRGIPKSRARMASQDEIMINGSKVGTLGLQEPIQDNPPSTPLGWL